MPTITCPFCSTEFDPTAIGVPNGGTLVRCPKCRQTFDTVAQKSLGATKDGEK